MEDRRLTEGRKGLGKGPEPGRKVEAEQECRTGLCLKLDELTAEKENEYP